MDEFYRFLGEKPAKRVRLAVMEMWKPFRNSTANNAPQAAILFDKFHKCEVRQEIKADRYTFTELKKVAGRAPRQGT